MWHKINFVFLQFVGLLLGMIGALVWIAVIAILCGF